MSRNEDQPTAQVHCHQQAADSLHSLIADGQYRNTSLGRDGWKTLIGSDISLQQNCNKEEFDAFSGRSDRKVLRKRRTPHWFR